MPRTGELRVNGMGPAFSRATSRVTWVARRRGAGCDRRAGDLRAGGAADVAAGAGAIASMAPGSGRGIGMHLIRVARKPVASRWETERPQGCGEHGCTKNFPLSEAKGTIPLWSPLSLSCIAQGDTGVPGGIKDLSPISPSLGGLMYVLVQHTISDPATFWNAAHPNTISPQDQAPPHIPDTRRHPRGLHLGGRVRRRAPQYARALDREVQPERVLHGGEPRGSLGPRASRRRPLPARPRARREARVVSGWAKAHSLRTGEPTPPPANCSRCRTSGLFAASSASHSIPASPTSDQRDAKG